VVNALYRRKDRDALLKSGFTLGAIPGGTSNGLVKALLTFNNEEYSVQNAAYLIAWGRKNKIDLTEIEQEINPNEKIYSFLSFFWGVLADCDINSECIRWMGSPRYTLWGVYRVIFRKIYEGTILYNGIQLKSVLDYEAFKKENSFKGKANENSGLIEETMNSKNL